MGGADERKVIAKRFVLTLLCGCFLVCSSGLHAPLWSLDERLAGAQKQKSALTVGWQTFSISADERISLYGGRRKQYLGSHGYWGEAGYGAITGKRAGFLEGGIMTGWEMDVHPKLLIDASVLVGAGGGGAAPQGGGLIIHPTLALGWKLNDAIQIMASVGYIHFINGNISSSSFDVHANLHFWELAYSAE